MRIDLSALEFIDCTGLEAIMDELASARRANHPVEVDRPVSAPVKRVITVMDVADVLWPEEVVDSRPALRVIEGEAPAASVDAIRQPRDANPLGLVGDPADRRPGSPGASASSDR